MNIKTSRTEINDFYLMLKAKSVGEHIELSKPILGLLIAIFGTLLQLAEILDSGCGIGAVRKLLSIFPNKKISPDSGDEDSEVEVSDPDTDEEPSEDDTQAEGEEPSQPEDKDKGKGKGKKPKNQDHPGKSGVDDYPNADVCEHHHHELKSGDICPECQQGKVYPKPRETLQFVGGPPISPVVHKFNDLVCNLCKAAFKVELTPELRRQGVCQGGQFTYSAIAMIAVAKYFFALPLYRTEHKGGWLGTHIPRSTQQDQIEILVNALSPLNKYLALCAANAWQYFADDTTGIILSKPHELKYSRGAKKPTLRDGRHSSLVVAITEDNHKIVLIKTAIIHAGEFMDEILNLRTNQKTPQVMWDRIHGNTITVSPYIDLACMQHARDNFYQLRSQDPKFIRPMLADFREIFENDAKTKLMSAPERLAYHQKMSRPLFQSIQDRATAAIKEAKYLPNSKLGKACSYVLKHDKELAGFLAYEGAPVCNNLAERTISVLVLLRNVIHHFKNELGAKFADTILRVGLSAYYNDVNVFEFFKLALAHREDIKQDPEKWLPWVAAKRYPHLILPENLRYSSRKPPRYKDARLVPT